MNRNGPPGTFRPPVSVEEDRFQARTRRGVETAGVLSYGEYRKLRKPETDLVDFFQASPLVGLELDLERLRDSGRDIDL